MTLVLTDPGANLTVGFDDPFYAGGSTTSAVPGLFDVAIGGRPFMIDLNHDITGFRALYFRRESIPAIRTQADTSDKPGEPSLNPDGAWRRAQESWVHGGGQTFVDREPTNSDILRFRTSKGVNPWVPWQLSLLPDTVLQRASTNSNLRVASVAGYLYAIDGQQLFYTSSALSATPSSMVWTAVTGNPAVAATSITTDGYNVWVAYGASGVYVTQAGAASMSSYVTGTVGVLGYVKGRLMAAAGASLYNITATGALPAALYTQPNTGFSWVAFAEGPGFIYAVGAAGDRSVIYSTAAVSDGTALAVPKVAGEIPNGETVTAARGYLGFLALGTTKGVHIASLDASGNTILGPLTPTGSPVKAFTGYDRFIYYGLTDYDATSSGVGRMDLSQFVSDLGPAFASDLMAAAQGDVTTVAYYDTGIVFTVAGVGVFAQSPNLVPSGTLSGGNITFGLDDLKTALFADVRHQALNGTVAVQLAADGGTPAALGTSAVQGSSEPASPFPCGQATGVLFELTVTLNRSATPTLGPVLTRVRMRATPQPDRTYLWTIPIVLATDTVGIDGVAYDRDPLDDFNFLTELQTSGSLTTLQVAANNHTVKVEDSNFVVYRRDGDFWSGAYTVQLKEFG